MGGFSCNHTLLLDGITTAADVQLLAQADGALLDGRYRTEQLGSDLVGARYWVVPGHAPSSDVMAIMRKEIPDLATAVAKAPRNSPCPCGSGLKVEHCHARLNAIEPPEPITYPVFVAEPRRRVSGMAIQIGRDAPES